MKLQKQKYHHDPENGVWGDCFRTCIACLLGIERDDVPHFYYNDSDGSAGYKAAQDWLQERGITLIEIAAQNADCDGLIQHVGSTNKGLPFLLGGTSRSGCGHFVVCLNGEIIHDPSLTDAGIVGPMEDGMYWLTFIGSDIRVSSSTDTQERGGDDG